MVLYLALLPMVGSLGLGDFELSGTALNKMKKNMINSIFFIVNFGARPLNRETRRFMDYNLMNSLMAFYLATIVDIT